MPYTYPYPHPAVAADVAIFAVVNDGLNLLLIERAAEPFSGSWALPGGFLQESEDLDACARRELREETGVDAEVLMHFANFSAPDRDPRERVISVAYLALLPHENLKLIAKTDAAQARWFEVESLPPLAFDHDVIVRDALESLRRQLSDLTLLFALLPKEFTLTELQRAYEAVIGAPTEKRNFRKTALASGRLAETDRFSGGAHRPARLYRVAR
jgi:8-oxo-dGTP diphosphatase